MASRSCDVVGAGGSSGVRSTGECVPGTRAAYIDGSSVTSAANAEVELKVMCNDAGQKQCIECLLVADQN